MSLFSVTPQLLDDLGGHHAAHARHFRRDRYFPYPTQVLVRHDVGVESCSLRANGRLEVAPQAHFLLAIVNLWNLEFACQQPRAHPRGIDEPTGFDPLSSGCTDRRNLLPGAFNFSNPLPKELRTQFAGHFEKAL